MNIEDKWFSFYFIDLFEASFDNEIRKQSEIAPTGDGKVLAQNS
jgi:hypothetical protein